MNLRILKKLSARAAPLLTLLGDTRAQYQADRECFFSVFVGDRKHWERSPCHPSNTQETIGSSGWVVDGRAIQRILIRTRAGRSLVLSPPDIARRGTVMVGAMGGGETPEWDEETAWEALQFLVRVSFTDWSADEPEFVMDFWRNAERHGYRMTFLPIGWTAEEARL